MDLHALDKNQWYSPSDAESIKIIKIIDGMDKRQSINNNREPWIWSVFKIDQKIEYNLV